VDSLAASERFSSSAWTSVATPVATANTMAIAFKI
jgi:hypothetical protein